MSGRETLVSVVIPTYNHAAVLGEAIRSIEAQTYHPTEIIVVDDCSTDDTERVVRDVTSAPTYIKCASGGIIAASRNVGIRAATGAYVAFLDADDVWVPDKLRQQLPHLADASIAAVASDLRYMGAVGYAPSRRGQGPQGFRDYSYSEIVRDNPIATSSTVVRRRDLESVGGFDESAEFRFIEDWELWLRLALHGRVRVLGRPLVTYRIAPQQRARLPILANRLKVLAKHERLGYLTRADAAEGAAMIHNAMGVAAFATEPRLSRESFRSARRLTSRRWRAALAVVASAATRLPRSLRVASLGILRSANRWLRFA